MTESNHVQKIVDPAYNYFCGILDVELASGSQELLHFKAGHILLWVTILVFRI